MPDPVAVAEMGNDGPLVERYLAVKFGNASTSDAVAADFAALVELPVSPDLIVAVPSSTPLARAFACAIGERFGVPIADVLRWVRHVPPLRSVPVEQRQSVVREALVAAPVSGTVLLVDDVVRSGATFGEAERALRAAGAADVACLAMLRRALD